MEQVYTPPCRLLSLPAELRLRIYEFAYAINPGKFIHRYTVIPLNDTKAQITSEPGWVGNHSIWPERCAGLLGTCKQINKEATHYLYDTQVFRVRVAGGDRVLKSRSPGTFCTTLQDHPMLKRIQRLDYVSHLCSPADSKATVARLDSVLRQFDGERASKACRVFLVIPQISRNHYIHPLHALEILRGILELERTSSLRLVQRQVYNLLWKEALKIGRMALDEDGPRRKLEAFLKENNLDDDREIGQERCVNDS